MKHEDTKRVFGKSFVLFVSFVALLSCPSGALSL